MQLDVRVTRHGPLVSDAINANNAALERDAEAARRSSRSRSAGRRSTPTTRTLAAFLQAERGAQLGPSSRDALRDFVVPSQNFVYADVDGHIGYYAPGHIPIRARGDGSRPADGWTGEAEWTGWVPFDELPHLYDPPEHFIVTANHRPAPRVVSATTSASNGRSRTARSGSSICCAGSTGPDCVRSSRRTTSRASRPTRCRCTRRRCCRSCSRTRTRRRRAIGRPSICCAQWNFDATADSAAAAIFQAWFHQLAPALVGDELGPADCSTSYADAFHVHHAFRRRHARRRTTRGWCDDVTTDRSAKRATTR